MHETSTRLFQPALIERLPGLPALWRETLGDPEIRIAVLDGPVDLGHPCLRGARLQVLPTLVGPASGSTHGTHVTSLIFGQHGRGPVAGIAPRCTGLLLPVFGQKADGSLQACSQIDLARAIAQALEAGAHLINISGGQLTASGEAVDLLVDVIRQAADRKVLVVAATGNDGCECLHVPAVIDPVLAVGALDDHGTPMPSSNWSGRLTGIMAPGHRISGAVPGGGLAPLSGTSVATPLVSGVAALLLSLQKRRGLPVDPLAVRQALLAGASPCRAERNGDCRRLLAGTLDIPAAYTQLRLAKTPPRTRLSAFPTTGRAAAERRSETFHPNQGGPMMTSEESVPVPTEPPPPELAGSIEPSCGCQAGNPLADDDTQVEMPAIERSSIANSIRPSAAEISAQDLYSSMLPFPTGQKAFVLGKLYYDFGTEARRDYFISEFSRYKREASAIYNPVEMARYMAGFPKETADGGKPEEILHSSSGTTLVNGDAAIGLIWTLHVDQDPVYAIVPQDQFAVLSFTRLINFLRSQAASKDPRTFRIALAGTLRGTTTLYNGTVVPILRVLSRGMYAWDIKSLLESTQQAIEQEGEGKGKPDHLEETRNFMLRIYYELRNLGVTSEDRAKNFAATNVYTVYKIFQKAHAKSLKLDKIAVARSPICRRNSDCWDIRLQFFNPQEMHREARKVWEYTIDVSDVVPVQVGTEREYFVHS